MILNVNLSNDITIHSLNDLLVLGKLENWLDKNRNTVG